MQPLCMTMAAVLERPSLLSDLSLSLHCLTFLFAFPPKCSRRRSSHFTRSAAPPQVESTRVCFLIRQHKHWSDWFASATHCWLNKPEQQRIMGDSTRPLRPSPALAGPPSCKQPAMKTLLLDAEFATAEPLFSSLARPAAAHS